MKKKIENKITFKTKLELLTPETMKLIGNTERKINKNKNGERTSFRNH